MAKKQKTCSCCGGDAGKFEQWHNRDTGYGLCRKCANWIETRETPDDIYRCYGVAGIHYEAEMFRLYGREFKVIAWFPNTENGQRNANAYMMSHDGACLLDAQGPKLILADRDDKGVPVREREAA